MNRTNEHQRVRAFSGIWPTLGERVFIDPQAAVIGRVTLGDDVSIWPMAVVRGDVNDITIGSATNVQDGCILHVTHDGPYSPGGFPLMVGDEVTVGHAAVLHGCTIGDRCLIGMGATILDGAQLEPECIVAAGSLVPPGAVLSSGQLYRGSPARAARALDDAEREALRYSAGHYVRLKDQYLGTGASDA